MRSATAPAAERVLGVEGLSVAFSGVEVLRDVSFELAPGELTGLIGSNGAGKTTLFRVILGLQKAQRGQVRVPQSGRRRAVGYVPQKLVVDADMPIRARDLVELGVDGHRIGPRFPSRARRETVEQMIAAVGAQAFAGRRVGRLSGGEQQRVLIAHALASRPRLLLLDEPLANLDLGSSHEIAGLLRRIATEQNVAVLVSAHEMNTLLPVMDRVVYLAGGRAASGTTEEVVKSDVLSALYGQHVDVVKVHGRVLVVVGSAPAGHLDGAAHLPIEVA